MRLGHVVSDKRGGKGTKTNRLEFSMRNTTISPPIGFSDGLNQCLEWMAGVSVIIGKGSAMGAATGGGEGTCFFVGVITGTGWSVEVGGVVSGGL